MKVRDVMTSPAITVSSDTAIRLIVKLLDDHRISAVPVVDSDGRALGVVSEGDLVAKGHKGERSALADAQAGAERRAYERRVRARVAGEAMTAPAITVDADDDLRTAAALMSRHSIGRAPVTDAGRVVGVVSRADVLRTLLQPDEDVARRVREVLSSKVPAELGSLEFAVYNGVVTLTGTIRLASTADVIAFHVDRVDGVICVDNRLRFRVDDKANADAVPPSPLGPLEMIL